MVLCVIHQPLPWWWQSHHLTVPKCRRRIVPTASPASNPYLRAPEWMFNRDLRVFSRYLRRGKSIVTFNLSMIRRVYIYIYIIYIYIIIHIFWFWNLPRNICKFLGTHSQPQFFHCEDDTCFFRRQGIPRVHSTSAFPSIQVLALILMEPLIAPGKSSLQDMSPGWMGHSAELENCSRWFFLHWKLYDLFNEYFVLYTQY